MEVLWAHIFFFEDKYVVVRILGQGGEGKVYLVTHGEQKEELVLKRRQCQDFESANEALSEVMDWIFV